jgi:hypothetical protein
MILLRVSLTVLGLVALAPMAKAACGGPFDPACNTGHAIEDVVKDVGKVIEKSTHDNGHAIEKGANDAAKASEKGVVDTGHAIEKATHDTGKASDGVKPLQPLRAWLAAKDIPPDAGAYGLVVFHSRPTSAASREKLKTVCTAFVHFFPPAELATVPADDQMITVWPIDNPDSREAKEDSCDNALDHYDLIASEQAITDAEKQHANFDGAGPYLVGWSPSKMRGVPDALVLVVDMSADNNQDDVDAKFLFWKNKIVQDPAAWRNGFSVERVRVAILNFVDHYGPAFVDTIKLIGSDKKP